MGRVPRRGQFEWRRAPEHTISFDPVTAKYFSRDVQAQSAPPVPAWAEGIDPSSFGPKPETPTTYQIAELVLLSEPRVNHFEEKAAFVPEGDLSKYASSRVDGSLAVSKAEVIDLTAKMGSDGTLDWTRRKGSGSCCGSAIHLRASRIILLRGKPRGSKWTSLTGVM